jgi:hypothetical protein
MKKLFCVLVIILFPIVLFSASNKKPSSTDLIFQVEEDEDTTKQKSNSNGPFGLKMGMTLAQITEVCNNTKPKQIEGDRYYVYPAKKHPLFKYYIAYVDFSEGLYCLQAVSDDIKTNDYGNEVKSSFTEIKDRISKTYGAPKIIDRISNDSLYREDKYWIYTLEKGARTYAAIWDSKLKDDLDRVFIYVTADIYPEVGWINLEYDFKNKSIVENSQDDVF